MNLNNRDLLEQVYRKKKNFFLTVAHMITRNSEDSEDSVHGAFFRLLTLNLPLEGYDHACGVLTKQVKWQALTVRRNRHRWSQDNDHYPSDPYLLNEYKNDYYPLAQIYWKYLDHMDPLYTQVLRMHAMGYTNKQIAQMLSIPSSEVVDLKFRGLILLRGWGLKANTMSHLSTTTLYKISKSGHYRQCERTYVRNPKLTDLLLKDPIYHSEVRRQDDKTDRIMEMRAQGKKAKEIAKILGITENNVRVRAAQRKALLAKAAELNIDK